MSKTNYPGINYAGHGSTVNMDSETGIRYGVISQNSVHPEAVDDIYFGPHTKDLAWEEAIDEMKQQIVRCKEEETDEERKSALRIVLKHIVYEKNLDDRIEEIIEHFNDDTYDDETLRLKVWDVVEQDFSDRSVDVEANPLYEHDGYRIIKCLDNDLMILKSPFFTHAQFCSPCVPGACNLDSPLEAFNDAEEQPIKPFESNRCYCLGHDFFDEDNKCPYPIYSVETGKLITP